MSKFNVDIEIINKHVRNNDKQDKHSLYYKSILTKQEIIKLINDEIKLDKEQQINLIDIIDHASLSEHTPRDEAQNDWEKKAELKRVCIEIESKGLAECRQTN